MVSIGSVADYQNDGCVITPNVLSAETLDLISPIIRTHTRRLDPNTRPMSERATYDRAFTQVMNLWREDAVISDFVFNSPLAEIAAKLMGVDAVRLYHDQALFKEPGGGHTPWHCDQVYWPIDTSNTVTAWFPLQDTPMDMGPLSFARGSADILDGRTHPIDETSDAIIGPMMQDCPYLSQPFLLGDVSWHSGWTYHNASPNLTTRPREAFTVIFIDARARLTAPSTPEKHADAGRWCPGIQEGEIIASPLNPILWSQP